METILRYSFTLSLIALKVCVISVPEDSADPGVGEFHLLDVDHFNTCKPIDKSSESYERTLNFIKRVIEMNKPKERPEMDEIPILLASTLV